MNLFASYRIACMNVRVVPLLLVLSALPLAAPAQTVPNSGQILQQVEPHKKTEPAKQPELTVKHPQAKPANDTTPFQVNRLVIEGNSVFDTDTLHALVASGEGRRMTLAQLQALAQRITDYYHAHGYPLARARVPAQTLQGGVVHVRVVEARYDTVHVANHSRVDDALLRATLAPMQPGHVVTQSSLDRSLLLMDDLPGVNPHATLAPGSATGTTRVDVQADAAPFVSGDVHLDNAGSRYTGRLRVGANLDLNSPLRHGDLLSLSALTSGHDSHQSLDYGRLAYQYTLNGAGTRLGAAYSALRYELGSSLSALDAHGTARVGSVWLAQPLVRSRRTRLDLRLQFDRKRLRDATGAAGLHQDRHSNDWTLGFHASRRDAWLGGGVTSASVGVTHGRLDFDNAAAAAADAATAGTQGSFSRWNASLARLQNLGSGGTRLYLGVSGQASSDNLDSSETFLLGGPASVRAYATGTAAGASGWLATLALHHDFDWDCAGRCQGRVFVDSGAVRIHADPWAPGNNHEHLGGAGLGFDWIGPRQWLARVQVAYPIGTRPSGRDHGGQWWLQVSKGF